MPRKPYYIKDIIKDLDDVRIDNTQNIIMKQELDETYKYRMKLLKEE